MVHSHRSPKSEEQNNSDMQVRHKKSDKLYVQSEDSKLHDGLQFTSLQMDGNVAESVLSERPHNIAV